MSKDYSAVPAVITLKNNSEENVGFRYFRVNFTEILEPEDEVVLTVATSEEYAYYATVANSTDGLDLTVSEG